MPTGAPEELGLSAQMNEEQAAAEEVALQEQAGDLSHPKTPAEVPGKPWEGTLKVHGKEVEVAGEEEWTKLAQKGMSADIRYQEASDKLSEAENALRIQEDFRLMVEEGDTDAFRRLGASLDIPGAQVDQAIKIVMKEVGLEGEELNVAEGVGATGVGLDEQKPVVQGRTGPVEYQELEQERQTAVNHAESQRRAEIVKTALDKDEDFGYNMAQLDDKQRSAVRDMVDDKIRGRLAETGGTFGDGAQILPEVIRSVNETLKMFGTPKTGAMGLGHSPGSPGRGVHPQKEPERVSSTEPGRDEYILQKLQHNLEAAEKE